MRRTCRLAAWGRRRAVRNPFTAANAAASTGKTLYVPKGTYKVVASHDDWSSAQYALKPVGANLRIVGDGPSSNIKLSAHEGAYTSKFPIIFLLSGLTGTVTVADLQVSSPARVNTTHSGPMAFSASRACCTCFSDP